MKKLLTVTALAALLAPLFLTSCTKTETEYIDKEVIVRDTVYIDKIITETDTIYIDVNNYIRANIDSLNKAFEPFNSSYPEALPKAKELIKQLFDAEPAGAAGVLIYMGKYNYAIGMFDTESPGFELIIVNKMHAGEYKAVKATHYAYSKPTNTYIAGLILDNAAGLAAPQADFAKNKFATFLSRADIAELLK